MKTGKDGTSGVVGVTLMIDLLLKGTKLRKDRIPVILGIGTVCALDRKSPHIADEAGHICKGSPGHIHPLVGIGDILLVILVNL